MTKSLDEKAVASPLSRRTLFAGAGTAGALATAAALLPRALPAAPEAAAASLEPSVGGYRLSEHVLHYYRTARV